MLKLNHKGVVQILITFILFLGILTGIYLVQKTQIFKSKAADMSAMARNTLLAQASAPLDKYNDRIVLKSEKQGIGQNPRYLVEYQAPFDSFMLVVFDTPIEEVRKEAENELLRRAGGDLQSLCNLRFSIVAPGFVTGGENAADDQLGICKKQPSAANSATVSGRATPSIIARTLSFVSSFLGNKQVFLSDKPIIVTQDLPVGVYISLCRNNETNAEGVWQIGNNPQSADFLYNQENVRCNDPVPDYLVFTQPVPTGSYLSLCSSDQQEWVWQVGESGRTADFLYNQDGCTPPSSFPKQPSVRLFSFTPISKCGVGQGFCSVEFLRPFFGENTEAASKICNVESSGSIAIVSPSGDVGLFQINLSSHGETIEHWQNVENNINKAVTMSGGGANWYPWSAAYEYACYNNKRIPACGFYNGKPSWQKDC